MKPHGKPPCSFFNQTASPENGCATNKSHPALKRVLVAGTLQSGVFWLRGKQYETT
jgi:hypothetical protein